MWVRGQEGSHRFYTGGENVSRDSWRLLEASRRGKGDAKVENVWDGAWETKVNHQNVSIWCSSMETSGQEDDSSVLALHKTLDVGLCSWHLLLASALERPVQQMESEPKGMEIAWGHQKKKNDAHIKRNKRQFIMGPTVVIIAQKHRFRVFSNIMVQCDT